MKRKRNLNDKISKDIIQIGLVLVIAVLIGTYLNKIWPQYQYIGIENINNLKESYSSNIPLKNIILSNLKSDFLLMIGILVFNLGVITAPIALFIVMVKGISIGYIINSAIIVLKTQSIPIVIMTLIKNIAIIIGIIIIMIISKEYIKNVLKKYKVKDIEQIKFLGSRYIINALIISCITVFVQTVLNSAFIWIIKFFMK